MKKKLISIILSFAVIATMIPAQTFVVSAATKTKTTVSTQRGLKKAVKNKKLKTLTIKTSKNRTFTIPKVYSKKMVVVVNSSKVKINISDKAIVNKFRIVKKNSNIKLSVAGKLSKINVEKKSTLSISGTTPKEVGVNVFKNADKSTINSSIGTRITIYAGANIIFKKGSEESVVTYRDSQKEVIVKNKTDGTIIICDSNDNKIKLAATETFVSSDYENQEQEQEQGGENYHPSERDDDPPGENETPVVI